MSGRTRITALVGAALLGLLVLAMGVGAFAAQDQEQVSVQVAVPTALQLSLSTSSINFGTKVPGDVDTAQTINATVNSNKAWNLYVSKDRDLQSGSETIGSSNFLFRGETPGTGVTIDTGDYTQFATSNTLIAHGTRGSGRTLTVRYSLTIPWDVEGNDTTPYTATHTYTATQP